MGDITEVFSKEDVLGLGPDKVVIIRGVKACRTGSMIDVEGDSNFPLFFTIDSQDRVMMMPVSLGDRRIEYDGGISGIPANWRPAELLGEPVRDYLNKQGAVSD